MTQYWRPLNQDELPYLASGDTLTLRLNYLHNPDRLPVTYVAALCVERRNREGTFLIEGTNTPIEISLTEAGRYADDGWHMTGEELSKIELRGLVMIHEQPSTVDEKSGEGRRARFLTCTSPHSAKVIFEGETVESPVALWQIGPVE
jgi:hypothetical protein